MDNKIMNEALRAPLASTDPSLGSYALAQASWNAVKSIVRK
ncbi:MULTISPECIES: hypothetical protein [Bifidobacterium]|uniref:Uncharacterized protein n=2 Tax=Bifidobacterium TaxID=1678 RepID=A0A261FM79_9BIFI|nr:MULTISPECIES: hypothetical protein [Bifidobacterium]OZG60292.1 hypothetical protein BLEM_1981 [Bifidobacterium lemurum]OZG69356.1 hypothetical protein BEUL_0762 [Bifidobacterium eulemuris]